MKSFNYVSVFNTTGYGVASTGLANQLAIHSPDLFIHPIASVQNNEINQEVRQALQVKPNLDSPTFCFWHLHDIPNQINIFKGPKVGYTTFELDTLRPEEVESANKLDMVGTASNWGQKVLSKYIDIKKTFVINHAFRATKSTVLGSWTPAHDQFIESWNKILAPISLSKETLLLSSIGKYESRKGFPELIKACIEDLKDQSITLIAFWHNPFIPDGFPYSFLNAQSFYPEFTKSGVKCFRHKNFRLVLMPPLASRSEVHSAALNSDFFISPSKGEGWNLPLFEMMSYGLPCIATLNTAHLDYAYKAIPIESGPLQTAVDGVFFNGQGSWYGVTKEQVASAIRSIPKFDPLVVARESIAVVEGFTWEKEAKKVMNLMKSF